MSPCKDCKKRVLGCHSTCEDYKRFTQEREYVKRQKEIDRQARSQAIESCMRLKKRSKK